MPKFPIVSGIYLMKFLESQGGTLKGILKQARIEALDFLHYYEK